MNKVLIMGAAVAALLMGTAAQAADAGVCDGRERVKTGTFTATAYSAGLIVGARWGDGTVTLDNGTSQAFHFKGGKLMDFGGSETKLTGTVYNLNDVKKLPGLYTGVAAGAAIGKGLGGVSITNEDCVMLNAETDRTGVQLSGPGPGGVEIELK